MLQIESLYQPTSVAEALTLLERHGDAARPLAGGTSLVLSKSSKVSVLVDLGRLGLDRISREGGALHVGAMVSCAQLRLALAGDRPSALSDAAASVGSRILQNHVTVGGNCVMVYAWSDLPVALLCLGGAFALRGREGERVLGAEAFFAEHPTRRLAAGELLVEVAIPETSLLAHGSAHVKLGRNAGDQAMASASVRLALAGGVVREARVVAGAVRALPQHLPETSDGLLGKEAESQAFAMAGASAAREARVSGDYRAGAEYRAALLGTLVEDALRLAATRAGGLG